MRWAIAAAVLLGLTGTISALGPGSLEPQGTAAWRVLIGAVALLAASALRGDPVWRARLAWQWASAGSLALVVNQLAFFAALDRLGVAVATVVTIAALPVTGGVIDAVSARRRPPRNWVVGVAMGIVGTALLVSGDVRFDLLGLALSIISGVSAALVGMCAQRQVGVAPLTGIAAIVGGAAVLLTPLAMVHLGNVTVSWSAWATVTALGLVSMAAAYTCWSNGLAGLSLGVVTAVGLLEPAVAAILAVVVLDETLGWRGALGVAVVLAGVGLSSVGPAATGRPPA